MTGPDDATDDSSSRSTYQAPQQAEETGASSLKFPRYRGLKFLYGAAASRTCTWKALLAPPASGTRADEEWKREEGAEEEEKRTCPSNGSRRLKQKRSRAKNCFSVRFRTELGERAEVTRKTSTMEP